MVSCLKKINFRIFISIIRFAVVSYQPMLWLKILLEKHQYACIKASVFGIDMNETKDSDNSDNNVGNDGNISNTEKRNFSSEDYRVILLKNDNIKLHSLKMFLLR